MLLMLADLDFDERHALLFELLPGLLKLPVAFPELLPLVFHLSIRSKSHTCPRRPAVTCLSTEGLGATLLSPKGLGIGVAVRRGFGIT